MDQPPAKRRRLGAGAGAGVGVSSSALCGEVQFRAGHRRRVQSLMDLSAQRVVESWTYEQVKEQLFRVPDVIRNRIVFWSFPRSEREILLYSSLGDEAGGSFQRGVQLLETPGAVQDILQVGFLLSASVRECPACLSSDPNLQPPACACEGARVLRVSLAFAQRRVTAVSCSCGGDAYCAHVVALLLFRLRGGGRGVRGRPPISDTLARLSRAQLQKLAQHLIAQNPPSLVPAAQELAEQLQEEGRPGAPDPTAGLGPKGDGRWALQEDQLRQRLRRVVKASVSSRGLQSSCAHISALIRTVREMLRCQDSNGPRVLAVLTGELVLGCWGSSGALSPFVTELWEQLASLWVSVVLSPWTGPDQRAHWLSLLQNWNQDQATPLEEGNHIADARGSQVTARRSVLWPALQCGGLQWTAPELQRVLRGDQGAQGAPAWAGEPLPLVCARISALRRHGYGEEALRLGLAVVSALRLERRRVSEGLRPAREGSPQDLVTQAANPEGWVGHPLDPIGCLFDTFLEACHANEDGHAPCPGTVPAAGGLRDSGECSVCVAVEVALWGLGQQRALPVGRGSQDRAVRCEERLISRLVQIPLTDPVIATLRRESAALLEGGVLSALGEVVPQDTVPMHSLARYLLGALVPHDPELAFRVALRAMRMPMLESPLASGDPLLSPSHVPGWFVLGHLETRQCELAASLLTTAKGDEARLRVVLDSILQHVHSALLLHKLARDAATVGAPPEAPAHGQRPLLAVALELGVEAARRTRGSRSQRRKEMVTWLAECAAQNGLPALLLLMQDWESLLTPQEAVTLLVPGALSTGPGLSPGELSQLAGCARTVALECLAWDPLTCTLPSLTLCQGDATALDAAYRIVVGAARGSQSSASLFSAARFLEQQGLPRRACTLATMALARLCIGADADGHPAVPDVLWAVGLARSLGAAELAGAAGALVGTVRCAPVLSEVLQLCGPPADHWGTGLASCLRLLARAAQRAYAGAVRARLAAGGGRRYGEVLRLLSLARPAFLATPGGHQHFASFLQELRDSNPGKKKLLLLLRERFG
ncbi:zinc finger SWIM domain-containing protein 4-like [Lepisosteus oculatus]|uniref:zinc finger SWIM domain-containing protein 4-like n=1 Tax=Lepisosteus oculatus TaxID=7918 RepID=UPI0035F52130